MADQQQLRGKVAVVTGGSSGIGAAAVRMLAEEGARVVVGYNKGADRAHAVIAYLPGNGHRAMRIVLEDSATMQKAAEDVRAAFGRADILVNSAGFTKPVPHGDLEALDDALLDRMLIANVRGPFAMIRAFAPLLREKGDGVVVNVSSIAAFTGSGSSIAYCGAKAALDNMTVALARVLGPEIRLLCVSPGAVETDFVAGRGHDQLVKLAEATPLKRVVQPEDVAKAIMACVLYLKTSTGVKIVCDGGRSLV
ncbi:MAG: SDR family oxidoreductase [Xanthobacteraceae bacterium]|nr:SDR family oxidoreductase [Xanthobacteraceae bacterium]